MPQIHADSLGGAADWARESLELHSTDEREYLYTWKELEKGETHDDLWNAAQLQLVREGTMHGFLRMYWAKKILEWTTSPSYALATAQYFNDRYAYDGNDPNGFVGVGWSIMGIHDMGWKERNIFGKSESFRIFIFICCFPFPYRLCVFKSYTKSPVSSPSSSIHELCWMQAQVQSCRIRF